MKPEDKRVIKSSRNLYTNESTKTQVPTYKIKTPPQKPKTGKD